ncbi:isoleucine--tRNA ligase [Actinotignum timonense]|uniref:isoleucine--tRNA ligase n=1 Tax=Actinotignum timonense TaxID=1870995 RepID=UPI002A83DEE6|nr:isoleucine--tRNA ligase [Actinotignum timonense]MDY5144469.1 isoleucine--tRNA ligase [Actinotignum timonense]
MYPLHREGGVPASPNFPKMEEGTLAFWKKDNTFQSSVEQRESGPHGSNEFVFYDGPPFANGLPHYGHLLTGYVKDVVGRYQTMRGRRVERRFGWDTHGLPAELEAQRILGIDSTDEIEDMGIATFNEACRSSVLRYTKEWEEYVTRQARWVDFSHDYKTLDTTYMESVLWAFKTLYDKGLAYDGYRVLPYCWNDETPLSNHELKMDDDVYKDRQDLSLTVGLRLETGELALIWTTTPWTLPSNLAIAVGPDIEYLTVVPREGKLEGERVVISAARLESYAKELGEDPEVVDRFPGSQLVGRAYAPIFDYFMNRAADEAPGPHAYHVIAGNFVTTEDGTGLVHIAPAFGEDDMFACQEVGIRPVVPVDGAGRFTSEVPDYEGTQVFDANLPITRDLREGTGPLARRPENERAVLVQERSYLHSYPHCWRCRKPLIYKAVSSWFVRVSAFRDRMVELNEQIEWTPAHIKHGQFGNWLAGARDWSISRNRFWGSPIPVWRSDDPNYPREDVYGSLEGLERDFGRLPRNEKGEVDLHRPYIDELTRPNPDDPTGKSTMRRITDVLDCWFESGSMPYAQVHYPFENKDWFEDHYPGDFIVEYIGQTRGWFYTLHVLATALFDRPAFRTCISHGIVLGDDGQKMSKSLRNYPDVYEMFDEVGADAMRFFLMNSPIVRGGNLIVTERALRDTVRQVLLPLWNAYYFFALYASTCSKGEGYRAQPVSDPSGLDVMDRYLLASIKDLADKVRTDLDNYDIPAACDRVRGFLDVLTNWYVRTSRDRFWNEDHAAFDTLYTALEVLMRVMAPLAPLVTEEIWKGLTGGRSVHLEDWPELPDSWADDALREAMDEARAVVSAAHSLRKTHQLRVRQPLRTLTIVTDRDLAPFTDLIALEVNVKNVELKDVAQSGMKVSRDLKVLPRELDPQLRKMTSALFQAAKAGNWSEDGADAVLHTDPEVRLGPGQFEITVSVEADPGSVAAALDSGSFIALDTEVDEELEAEGYARDVVRAVQDERKNAQLHVADRISLKLTVPAERVDAVTRYLPFIQEETLAVEAQVTAVADGADGAEGSAGAAGAPLGIEVTKVAH